MKYSNPTIESSYRENDLGRTLYDFVLETKPKKIIEFGTLYGYSAMAMAMALDELGEGMIYCYDLWDKYPFKHTSPRNVFSEASNLGLTKFITVGSRDFHQWIESPEPFDLLHVDISNDGETFLKTHAWLKKELGHSNILLEGGSLERDQVEWMITYNKIPINSTKASTGYRILNDKFPSISIL
jgi:hypothetical protein